MIERGELTDKAWERIAPPLPDNAGGRRWRDHRQVINAILWKLHTGAPWRDLPERYGPWKAAHERLKRWTMDSTWQKILDEAIVKRRCRRRGRMDRLRRLLRHPSPSACRRGAEKGGCSDPVEAHTAAGEYLGHSRGGLSSKIHLAVDGQVPAHERDPHRRAGRGPSTADPAA